MAKAVGDGGRVRLAPEEQTTLPGEEFLTPAEAELGPLAHDYATWRDERMAVQKREVEAKRELLDACIRNEITSLTLRDGTEIVVDRNYKVKVVAHGQGDDDTDDPDANEDDGQTNLDDALDSTDVEGEEDDA